MGTEITALPNLRAVYSDTYANFPTSGLAVGDLAYATDRLVLYRWSGTAWEAITIHSSSGVAANIPNAADLPDGSLYFEIDTTYLKQVQSGAWAQIGAVGIPALTVAGFQVNAGAAVGGPQNPEQINDGDTGEVMICDAINEGAEITLLTLMSIKEFRHYGHNTQNEDGEWKIMYQGANGAWSDWVTGLATRGASWSTWDDSGGAILALAIRFICTTKDSGGMGGNKSYCGELEVRG